MRCEEIKEGSCYVNEAEPRYFRRVDLVVESPTRPGGAMVAWSTDGFSVRRRNGDDRGRTYGKCGLATFAKWATKRL